MCRVSKRGEGQDMRWPCTHGGITFVQLQRSWKLWSLKNDYWISRNGGSDVLSLGKACGSTALRIYLERVLCSVPTTLTFSLLRKPSSPALYVPFSAHAWSSQTILGPHLPPGGSHGSDLMLLGCSETAAGFSSANLDPPNKMDWKINQIN
ncbi:hypothetical protein BDV09DRAFT_102774 [Aspergillus tetrazonus]